ncbi:MAG TPA: nuclear transport factor 2 family protein [Thermoleophilaceae bacterium]|nr:nuclear transport factor 2 family protein [Thermoleophilaceae bacterium]
MDEARRKLIDGGYAAINGGDLESALQYLDPEIEVVTSGAFLDRGEVYRGHDGVRHFLRMLDDAFDEFSYQVLEVTELDENRVLTLLTVNARGKGSGLDVKMPAGHIWTLGDDKALRLEAFADHESARAAAGIG